eukprot:350406-Chlamydomonas_euryale.AAC.4
MAPCSSLALQARRPRAWKHGNRVRIRATDFNMETTSCILTLTGALSQASALGRVRTNKSLPRVRLSHLASLRHMRVLSHFQQPPAANLNGSMPDFASQSKSEASNQLRQGALQTATAALANSQRARMICRHKAAPRHACTRRSYPPRRHLGYSPASLNRIHML